MSSNNSSLLNLDSIEGLSSLSDTQAETIQGGRRNVPFTSAFTVDSRGRVFRAPSVIEVPSADGGSVFFPNNRVTIGQSGPTTPRLEPFEDANGQIQFRTVR